MLHIHRAERADRLVAALADAVAVPPADPLRAEIVAVPTRGVERWLTQQLSAVLGASAGRSDGVCANVDFPFPGRLIGRAVADASQLDRDTDPWRPEHAVWPLLEVVEAGLDEPELAPLAAHLGRFARDPDDARSLRRFSTVRHLADLYDRYAVHRPQMLRAWLAGDDSDGDGLPLPGDLQWQAHLWRSLRNRIDQPSVAERLDGACERLAADPGLTDLADRLSLFGLTRLPASYLDVLRALAVGRDVHLFLLHPSPVLWQRVRDADVRGVVRRAADPTANLPRNPLLASWGQDAREMQLVLGSATARHHHRPLVAQPQTLLQRIQADIRADLLPAGAPLPGRPDARPALDRDDRSLQVHACHGRARQVEVVRDAILHLLQRDPTLEPRDVIVMCPDVETFAPLIHAAFGVGDGGDSVDVASADRLDASPANRPSLRVRLADRSLRQTNPVLAVVAELLALADARVTASQVLDLAGREPVRRRFRFDDDDLARIEGWVADGGIRWGLDAARRAPFQLDSLEHNTWRAGLDRLLLGAAMAEEGTRLYGGVLPLDDVDSGDIDLAGRFAELIDRVAAALDALRGPQSVAAWTDALAAAAVALTQPSDADAWQHAQLQRLLDEVVAEAGAHGAATTAPLALGEVRALLADRLRGRPTRANFRTGHLTVCTLVPMRSVPHRVVCLLGLDDGVFPRRTAPDGDDVLQHDPYVGDRDARSEDRQLLLDALLAATDHLVITYSGRDERTNGRRPPAVPVGELLDVVDATVRADGDLARDRVLVHHPLQPFDPRNFLPGVLGEDGPWSFDAVALGGARAWSSARASPPLFMPRPLPRVARELVEVEQVVRFVQHPVKEFLRQRLEVYLGSDDEDPLDALPVELDHLEQWGVGQRLLDARLAGADPQACAAAEAARGLLPPGELGRPLLNQIGPVVDDIVDAAHAVGAQPDAGSIDVSVALPNGRMLVGTVAGVRGDLLQAVTYSRVAAKHRLAAWVRLLAVTASHPTRPFRAVTVGRGRGRRVAIATIACLDDDPQRRRQLALRHLAVLVDLYDRGLCAALPVYCKTSAAYAFAARSGDDPVEAARREWESDYDFEREDREPEHRRVLGGVLPFAHLLAAPPRHDETGPGWDAGEATRFGRYARRLWDGLLDREEVEQR